MNIKEISKKLYEIGAIKFGSFTLKSGIQSPIYIDLRTIISFPHVLEQLAQHMWSKVELPCDLICGVPYTAIPIATAISVRHNIPMVMRGKEAKAYGTGKIIEGVFQAGQTCVVIEDLVTTGASVFETITPLADVGIEVKEVAVILDREQGGRKRIEENGIKFHSLFSLRQLLAALYEDQKISNEQMNEIEAFWGKMDKSYSQRAQEMLNPMGAKLLHLMDEKQTNLSLSADVTTSAKLLELADTIGPHIAVLKIHIDIITDFTPELTKSLVELSLKHKFLIFEDRKFADIGNTVKLQYQGGVYRISEWADIVNAHTVSGPGIIESLKSIGLPKGKGLLLLAEMSSKDNLAKGHYTEKTLQWALEHGEYVMGFIAQRSLRPSMITMTPGVSLSQSGDALGQQYTTPEYVIGKQKSDVIIVGRGIIEASDPVQEAVHYRKAGWQAYQNRLE